MARIEPILGFIAPQSHRLSSVLTYHDSARSLLPSPLSSDDSMLLNSQDIIFSPETLLAPLNSGTPEWLRSIVWTDFRLAVTFFVVSPLILLAWSAYQCRPSSGEQQSNEIGADAVLRVITGYWQASSLLLITVLLNIGASPIGVVTGAVAQLMIWVSLNWWQSLNDEASSSETLLGQVFGIWRTVTSWVAGVGVAIQLPFLRCAVGPSSLVADPFCAAWLEPPNTAASIIGIASSELLSNFATAALTIYICYLLYYASLPLQTIGRNGRAPRKSFTLLDPLIMLDFLEASDEEN